MYQANANVPAGQTLMAFAALVQRWMAATIALVKYLFLPDVLLAVAILVLAAALIFQMVMVAAAP